MIFDRTITADCGELVKLHPESVANNVMGKASSLALQMANELTDKGVPDQFPTSPHDGKKRADYKYEITVRFWIEECVAEEAEKPKAKRGKKPEADTKVAEEAEVETEPELTEPEV